MHNTLRIDGLDQAEPATPFSWRGLVQSKAERWIQGKNFDLLIASHNGYQRDPLQITHRRWVVSLKNGMYLVRDRAEGAGRHRLESIWHLGPELQPAEKGVFRAMEPSQGLALLAAAGLGWSESVSTQSWSPVYGQKAPAKVVTFSKATVLPDEFCLFLVAWGEAREFSGSFACPSERRVDSSVMSYRYHGIDDAGASIDISFFFWDDRQAWREAGISSDSKFVCWIRSPNGERLFLADGSHAVIDGGPALRFKRKVAWGEIAIEENRRNTFSSDPEAIDEGICVV